MKRRKKQMPLWFLILMDILVITVYTGGFYGIYYLIPRELESSGVDTAWNTVSEETISDGAEVSADYSGNVNEIAEEAETSKSASDADATSETGNLGSKFSEYFTDTVVSDEDSYSSSNILITVETYTKGSGNDVVTYYVADIYLADIECLQSGFAEDTYGIGYTETVLSMDESLGAILAMNGDYYGNGGNGVVIRNGKVYRKSSNSSDVCVLYYDGTMKTYSADEFDLDQAVSDGAWQAWCFGPELLDETGGSMTDFTADGHVAETNPRSALGYYEPGHYCMVVVDGRQSGYSSGLTLSELSELFKELGCTSAYNMDGGKSSEMTFDDSLVNQPCGGGREVSDCIMIKEVD